MTKVSHLPACWAPSSHRTLVRHTGLTELDKSKKFGLERRGQKNKRERGPEARGVLVRWFPPGYLDESQVNQQASMSGATASDFVLWLLQFSWPYPV